MTVPLAPPQSSRRLSLENAADSSLEKSVFQRLTAWNVVRSRISTSPSPQHTASQRPFPEIDASNGRFLSSHSAKSAPVATAHTLTAVLSPAETATSPEGEI